MSYSIFPGKMICVIINERKTWTTGVKIRDENL
ncbi:hypothetical protein BAPNAU_3552 [Bacillus velezensis NAU-B3]|nr:hypothetical protein BAPNAU_3552 [Bacillus velezensis NAU-B3]